MQRRRHAADEPGFRRDDRQVGMALQAYVAHLRARQHPRIGRAVRLVAGAAAFQPHRSMLEDKRPALVAMALHAARFVSEGCFHAVRAERAVRIVAVHARHGAFRQAMLVGTVEGRPLRKMASGALALISDFLCSTSFAPPAPCTKWQVVQPTWFLA